jgi:hypothetical protein
VNCVDQSFIQDTTVTGYTHPAPAWTNNIQLYGMEGFIMHDQAGRWTYTPGPAMNSVSTAALSTNQANVTSLDVTGNGAAGSTSYQDPSEGYAWRVENGGAINLDFGANGYLNSWIESYQNGTGLGKPLLINTKYHAPTYFGGDVGINGVGLSIDSSGNLHAGAGEQVVFRCVGVLNNGVLTVNAKACGGAYVDTGLRVK